MTFRSSAALPGPRVVLRDRRVQYFVASRFFSGAAITLVRATVAWQVFAVTGSAFHLGLVGLIQFLPVIPCSLLGGAVADSANRKRVMVLTQLASFAAAVLLLASERMHAPVSAAYAIVFVSSIATSIENPSRMAMLPSLVPKEQFPAAVVVQSTVMNLSWVTGPVVAGFVIHAGGAGSAYALSAALWACSLASLGRVLVPEQSSRRFVGLAGIREGLAFVRDRRPLIGAMTLDMFAVIFASVQALLPVYASQILHVGPKGYGLLASAVEIGTLAMAVALLLLPSFRNAGRLLLVSVGVYGVAMIVFGLSRWFPLSLAALAVAGLADEISMVTRSAIIQLSTPDEMRGRVSSINMIFIGASNQLGAMESGFVAALTTATVSVVGGGVVCLVVLAVVAVVVPELGRYRVAAE